MIKIQINYGMFNNSDVSAIQELAVSGHAVKENGRLKELCASISMATTITSNAIVFLSLSDNVEVERYSGYFKIKVIKENDIITNLLENLRFTLQSLEEQYPDYIEDIEIDGLQEISTENNIMLEKQMEPEMALLKLGNIPLEFPSHPHLSMPMDNIREIQKAYKIVQLALCNLRELRENKEERK